ncbi:glucosylceramide transporter ABCA12-like [Nerophis lumbriciformis]|uniref:glucosylceramide transporter ABCA12-like n=1 Tax=Nerophis lumbriciformis TaxID=546530 RepID=UPI002ADF9823|nr:glucosylceramide transporter ABCA12-like [Nerophis lumbriciformis]
MAFFQQLKLLLWKNWLNVTRNPVWSLTLIIWPVIIFIIVAVTRNNFPPDLKSTCYVAPRNLPSTGFFPFLQTLMCNADSRCHNTSRLNTSHPSRPPKITKRSAEHDSSALWLRSSFLAKMLEEDHFYNWTSPKISKQDTTLLLNASETLWRTFYQRNLTSVFHTKNTTLHRDHEALDQMMESLTVLKRAFCTVSVAVVNPTPENPLSNAVLAFCYTNSTVFEAFLLTLNQILKEEMLSNPDELAKGAGAVMLLFQELQNQTSLWENLLDVPQLAATESLHQMLDIAAASLSNIQGVMQVIDNNFPQMAEFVSPLHALVGGLLDVIRYVQKWPGKDVYLSLADLVQLPSSSINEALQLLLQNIQIPLDQALALTLDRELVRSYICDPSNNPLWLVTACTTGTVDMLLDWITPKHLAQQALLAWSQHVAPHDVSFAKGLLHSLMGVGSPRTVVDSSISGQQRNVATPTLTMEEELFLNLGQVVLEVSQVHPGLDMMTQHFLSLAFHSMNITTCTIHAAEGINTYLTLNITTCTLHAAEG